MVVGGVDQVLVVGSKMEHGDEPYLARKAVSCPHFAPAPCVPCQLISLHLG